MVGGRVERVEAMIFVLNLRPVGDGEADLRKARTMSSVTCVSGCNLPSARRRPGSVKSVGSFGSAALSSSSSRRGERGFEFHLGGVDEFAGGGLFLLRQRAELFHQRGELAVRPDPRALGLFERGEVGAAFSSASAVCFSGSISFSKDISSE
jgi:hypothetical protein